MDVDPDVLPITTCRVGGSIMIESAEYLGVLEFGYPLYGIRVQ